MRIPKALSAAALAAAALTTVAVFTPAFDQPAEAQGRCVCKEKKTREGRIRCYPPSGEPRQQEEYCTGCGWEYVNTGDITLRQNYCLVPRGQQP